MHLRRLSLTGFRNLGDTVLELPPAGVAIVGANAQGKTNLLEAIDYLETFRSFRNARDDQLVRFGDTHFRVVAELGSDETGGDERRVAAAYHAGTRTKKVTVDGDEVARLGDAIGRVGAVMFTPDDVRLVSDGPQERRRFLDVVLSLNSPSYLKALQGFRHALSQRNAALRDRSPGKVVAVWNGPLVQSGAEVTAARGAWIRELSELFSERYREISGGASGRLEYEPSIPDGSDMETAVELEEAYRTALAESHDQETRRHTTVVGPHRDEMKLIHEGEDRDLDLRQYGSGGQRRTGALTLRLLEVETVRRRRGYEPVLLLDDVFAELDEARSVRVLELMNREIRGQVLLTAPKEADVRLRGGTMTRWTIEGGEIRT